MKSFKKVFSKSICFKISKLF